MTKTVFSLKSIHDILRRSKPSSVCLVTSERLAKKLTWAINEIGVPKSRVILLPDGERAKEWNELGKLLEKLSRLNLDRNSIVLALGGGTIGDVIGFAASIYLRGVRYIQIPTTLLAQVDSAHGGKTGINFLKYKNQIGSFHPPIAIIADRRFLLSLSSEQVVDGLGEIIKAGFIKNPSILSLLQRHTVSDLLKSSDMAKIIARSIAVKNHFTDNDFKDKGSRQILNVGHTLGHAIELKYGISHGRAVLVGMLQELNVLESMNMSPKSIRKDLEDLLAKLEIKTDTSMKADWKTIIHDKKILGDTIDFPVIEGKGKARIIKIGLKVFKNALK